MASLRGICRETERGVEGLTVVTQILPRLAEEKSGLRARLTRWIGSGTHLCSLLYGRDAAVECGEGVVGTATGERVAVHYLQDLEYLLNIGA